MKSILTRIMANKHTSGAALFFLTLEILLNIAQQWFPAWFAAHTVAINNTVSELQKLAMAYGLLMSSDAKDGGQPPSGASGGAANIMQKVGLILVFFIAFSLIPQTRKLKANKHVEQNQIIGTGPFVGTVIYTNRVSAD